MNAWMYVAIIVVSTVASDLLQSWEMKRQGEMTNFGIGHLLKTLLSKLPLIASVVFLAISFYAFLALLQVADLSFAVPATALSLVAETILARLLLKEKVTAARWAGTALVTCGVYLLAL
ncbi:MAG: EamA family transporter [Acidobacteria bacterium]|jgi:drug/metabolite transporter (DMT)-like permease|nr:EamA family transporter [Acidobacteriota bacterium]